MRGVKGMPKRETICNNNNNNVTQKAMFATNITSIEVVDVFQVDQVFNYCQASGITI